MKIILSKPTEIVTTAEVKKTISEINILSMNDLPNKKEVKVFTKEKGVVLLWSGDEYDQAGQWTDDDVKSRIKVVLGIS
jgi:hypothetical protein